MKNRQDELKDFFVSYNSHDKAWSEWIAWTLEERGFSTIIQDWDFRPGGDFVLEMHKAAKGTKKTIAVLSDHYSQVIAHTLVRVRQLIISTSSLKGDHLSQ